jgi:hypothetical protein
MYKGVDFFVVEKMQLNIGKTDEDWSGTVSLVKYQFSPNKAFDELLAFGRSSETLQPNPEVMSYLERKFIGDAFEPIKPNTTTTTPTPTPTVKPTTKP